jgi:hypothetical protein
VAKSLGFTQLTGIDAAAKGLAQGTGGAIPTGSAYAIIQAEGQDVRWRDDGTDPTASAGQRLYAGDTLQYDLRLDRIRFIGAAAGAFINVTFYSG